MDEQAAIANSERRVIIALARVRKRKLELLRELQANMGELIVHNLQDIAFEQESTTYGRHRTRTGSTSPDD